MHDNMDGLRQLIEDKFYLHALSSVLHLIISKAVLAKPSEQDDQSCGLSHRRPFCQLIFDRHLRHWSCIRWTSCIFPYFVLVIYYIEGQQIEQLAGQDKNHLYSS